jgi:ABC-type multidrug transport system fused ATPase/permease subunit
MKGANSRTSSTAVLRRAFSPDALKLAVLAAAALVTAVSEVAVLSVLLAAVETLAGGEPYVLTGKVPVVGVTYRLSAVQLLWACAGMTLLRAVSQSASMWATTRVVTGYEARLRRGLFGAYLRSTWSRQSRELGGRMQLLLTRNVEAASTSMSNFGMGLSSIVSFAILVVAAFSVDWRCAAIVLVVSGFLFVLIRPLSGLAQAHAREKNAAYSKFINMLSQGLTLAKELRVFGVVDHFERRCSNFIGRYRRFRSSQHVLARLVPIIHQAVSLFILIGGLTAVYLGGGTDLGSLSLVVLLLLRALTYGQTLQVFYHAVVEGVPYIEELHDAEDDYVRNAAPRGGAALDRIESLEMRDVGFAYEDGGDDVLDGIDFGVRRGEIIGIVGPSGSGKSTLMQLLLRLRSPRSGLFSVNGRPVDEIDLESWFRRVSFVPQESVLFDESLEECIRFHRDEIDEAGVRRAAEEAGIASEIAAFPDGFQTIVGERGGKLSGGQRQRVCIARALAGRPDVIVFDEPTSALDVHSEGSVVRTLASLRGSVTIFIIAHRLSTLNICDKIMVLHEGRVRSFGPPKELAETDDYYGEALRLARVE